MCGILGVIGNHNVKTAEFENALTLLQHRGPDGSGVFTSGGFLLGHRRLAILDLSDFALQPFRCNEYDHVLSFNGEIYNYIELASELRSEGYQRDFRSDTEVLYFSLIHWGKDAIKKLNGMFAFAFCNIKSGETLLARDRFGVKPLSYTHDSDKLAFSSEPKSLLRLFPEYRKVDDRSLIRFMVNNELASSERSFYKGIFNVPPAHYLTYNIWSNVKQVVRYWDYPLEAVPPPIDDLQAEFEALFDDAVDIRLRADVPVGITLSGGVDSTAILMSASAGDMGDLISFTSVYQEAGIDEGRWARQAVSNSSSRLIEVETSGEEFINSLRSVCWHMDSPNYSPAVIPLSQLFRTVANTGVKVILEGQGADEAFAGYPQYHIQRLVDATSGSGMLPDVRQMKDSLTTLINTFGFKQTATWFFLMTLPGARSTFRNQKGLGSVIRSEYKPLAASTHLRSGSAMELLKAEHSERILPGLLRYGDAVSMQNSVECRHPFLDYRLVEWIFKYGSHLLFNQNVTKPPLRSYLFKQRQVQIAKRKDKKGYPTPISTWMENSKNEVASLISASDSRVLEWCDEDKIRRIIENHSKGRIAADHHLYKLIATELWLRECL
ncbi:asparagine synthase (glutamine-hydrolyzing) [Pseudomonadales bacterium]|nr:asparagine synthase (glutamine-hydrolyzing) [Pseudomonadales bacterium]